MDFGERLSDLRTKNKLTQQELANRLNIAKSTLAMYETGKREPSFETLQKIADFFEVSVDYLLGRTDNPKPSSLNDMEFQNDENIFFFDLKGLSEEDIEKVKEHIEFLRYQARKHHEQQQKENK